MSENSTKENTEDLLKNLQKFNSCITFKSAKSSAQDSESDSSDSENDQREDSSGDSEEDNNQSLLLKQLSKSSSISIGNGKSSLDKATIKVKPFFQCHLCLEKFDHQSKLVKHVPICFKKTNKNKSESESESDYDSDSSSPKLPNLSSSVSISSRKDPVKLPPGISVSSISKSSVIVKPKTEENSPVEKESASELPPGLSLSSVKPAESSVPSVKVKVEVDDTVDSPRTASPEGLNHENSVNSQNSKPEEPVVNNSKKEYTIEKTNKELDARKTSENKSLAPTLNKEIVPSVKGPKGRRGRKRKTEIYKPSPPSKKKKNNRSQSPDYIPPQHLEKRTAQKVEESIEDFDSIVPAPISNLQDSSISTRRKGDFKGFYYELEYPDYEPDSPELPKPVKPVRAVAKKKTSKKSNLVYKPCVKCNIEYFDSYKEFENHHLNHIKTGLSVQLSRDTDSPSIEPEDSNSRSSLISQPEKNEDTIPLKLKFRISDVENSGKKKKKKFTILNDQDSNLFPELENSKDSKDSSLVIKKSSSPLPEESLKLLLEEKVNVVHEEKVKVSEDKTKALPPDAKLHVKEAILENKKALENSLTSEVSVLNSEETTNEITLEVAKVEKRENSPVPSSAKILSTKEEASLKLTFNSSKETSTANLTFHDVVADVHQPDMTLRGTPSPSVTPQAANSPIGHQFSPNVPQNPSPVPVQSQTNPMQEDTSFQSIISMNEDQSIPPPISNQDQNMIPPSMDQNSMGTNNAPTLTTLQSNNQFNTYNSQNIPAPPTYDAPSSYEPQYETLSNDDWMNDYESGQRIAAAMSGSNETQNTHAGPYIPGAESGQGSFEQLCLNDSFNGAPMSQQQNVNVTPSVYTSNASNGIFPEPDMNYMNGENQNGQQQQSQQPQQSFDSSNSEMAHTSSPHTSSPVTLPPSDSTENVTTPRITIANNLMPTTTASEAEILPSYNQSWSQATSQPFGQNTFQNTIRAPLRPPTLANMPISYRPSPRPRVRGRPPLIDNIPNTMYRPRGPPPIQPVRGRGRGMSPMYPTRSPVPQKRVAINQNNTSPLKAVRRPGDINVPSRQKDNDCQIIAVANRNEGMPVIANVQGNSREERNRTSTAVSDSTIHLNDSVTLSVRTNNQKDTAPKTTKSGDAGVVANLLASRGITVTPAASEKEAASSERRLPTATDLNLSSAISVHPPASRDRDGFAVPAPPTRSPTVNDIDRPPRPPTVDLTAERAQCTQCDKTFPNQGLLADHAKIHQQQEKSRMPYKCHLCSAGFSSQKTQQAHYQQFHQLHLSAQDLAIPIIDIRNPVMQRKMAQLGVKSFLPLSNLQNRGAGGVVGLPILSLESINSGQMSIQQWGITDVLSLGPPKTLGTPQQQHQRPAPNSPIRNMGRPM